MKITVSHNGVSRSLRVSSSTPETVAVSHIAPPKIEVQLFRDGTNGKDAYEIAVENGYLGTREEFTANLVDADVDFNAYYILSKN
jgi:hypothetical protein